MQDKLDGDLALLRRAFNQRILYFRQLQEISDSVTDVVWEEATIAMALQASLGERTTLENKMNMTRARQRYLDNLVNNHDELESDEDDGACILCRCDFTRGFITQWYETLLLCRILCDLNLLLRMIVLMYSAKWIYHVTFWRTYAYFFF